MRMICSFALLTTLYTLLSGAPATAGLTGDNPPDSAFIATYADFLTTRVYLSQKYTSIAMGGSSEYPDFRYRPNTSLNMGIGVTYHSLSLNLALGIPGINNEAAKGETKYLDLQSHFYNRKFVVDLFGQFYSGYYLAPKNFIAGYPGYYLKPDLKVRLLGTSAYYLFNHDKFSYRATLIQSEWQKKSAGTFLLGFDFFYGILKSASTLIPREISRFYPQGSLNRLRFINFGPGLGYAHTFVYKRHWFATGSLTANVTASISRESSSTGYSQRLTVAPNFLYRIGIGYNSATWAVIASLINNTVTTVGAASTQPYMIRTGNYRLTLARRFPWHSPGIKKKMNNWKKSPQ